jgi:hypothetical protein
MKNLYFLPSPPKLLDFVGGAEPMKCVKDRYMIQDECQETVIKKKRAIKVLEQKKMDIAAGLLSISAMIQSQVNSSKSNSLTEQAMISANLMSLFQIEKDAMIYGILSSSKKLDKIFSNIQDLISLKNELEERVTCILSDYTQLMNQVSLVATLMLIVTSGTLGSLLGNTENQVKWKIDIFVISCVFTMIISVCAVVESFFTSMLIYESEAKFSAGMMSKNTLRTFNSEELASINKSFAFVVITFFLSFLTFPFTILSMIYVGLGLSNFDIGGDSRMAAMNPVFNASINTLSSFEPEYVSIALTLSSLIAMFYILFLWRFFGTYLKWIAWPCDCCCILKKTLLLTPLIVTTEEYDELQDKLHGFIAKWCETYNTFIQSLNSSEIFITLNDGDDGNEEINRMSKDLNGIFNSYKLVIIENIKETQGTRFETVQSIKKVNESRKSSKDGIDLTKTDEKNNIKINYTEMEPLLF